jgi:hypothetical protein
MSEVSLAALAHPYLELFRVTGPLPSFGLWSIEFAVMLSSTGAINLFKEMTPATSGVIAEVSPALPYPEPLRVTGPLQSLVLRAEDMWRKHNQ